MKQLFGGNFKHRFKFILVCILLVVVGSAALLVNAALQLTATHAASTNPITLENQQAGSTGWQFDDYNKATNHQIEGYASLTSVNQGGQVNFMVSLSSNAQYTMDIYRMGYYPHGTNPDGSACVGPCGGRLMMHIGPLSGFKQTNCPTTTSGSNFGMIECSWTVSYALTVPTSWTTGNYIVKLRRSDTGLENYMTFVVRSDNVPADIVYSMDVTTWQAYNFWGGSGNSNVGYNLYGKFNDVSLGFLSSTRAYTVSFDRPYMVQGSQDGAGNFMVWDYPMVRWMEAQGYNITYVTNVDQESNPQLFAGRHVFVNTGHDEYYSDNMRNSLKNAINAGVNMAFFSANNIYSRITWQNSSTAQAYRQVHDDKGALPGSTTYEWRSLTPSQPENAILGVMQNGVATARPFLVYDPTSWIYAGTGLVKYNGTVVTSGPGQNAIQGLVGYEFDERAVNASSLSSYVSYEPPGLQQVGHSNVPASDNGVAAFSDATLYTAPSGAIVFSAGTIQWSFGLDNGFDDGFCDCNHNYANSKSQQITTNILNKFVSSSTPAPVVNLNPTSVTFSTQVVNTTSAAQTVTLSNTGTASLSISSIGLSGTNASDFAQTNNCPATLNAGTNCTINVTFTPTAGGSRSASVTITDNAAGSPQSVALTGTGVVPGPAVTLSPTSVSFGNQATGTTSAAQTVTLTNSGTAALTINSIAVSGTNASDFAQTNNCPASLNVNANCTINVTFTPTATGTRSANVTVTDNAPGSPHTVALTGTGVVLAPVVSLSPTSLGFGNQNVGTTSAAQTVSLTNTGTAALTINSIAVSGTNASDFAQTNNCPASLNVNASCTISVTFTPSATGTRIASVILTDNAANSPQSIALGGAGVTAGTYYFNDDFESGNLSKWNVASDSTGQIAVQSSVAHSGTHAAAFTDGIGQYAYMKASLSSPQTQTYTRFYFRYSSLSASTEIADGLDANGKAVWTLVYNASSHSLEAYFFGGSNTRLELFSNNNVLQANTWYSLEVQMNEASSGQAQVWVNGQSIGTVSGNLAVTNPYATLELYEEMQGTSYYDDVVVSATYNGV
jgi:Abnormal spindle-like microcephaly-assoc'd, ASPM-SPD-2-Hydin